jgi:hypothetical protein
MSRWTDQTEFVSETRLLELNLTHGLITEAERIDDPPPLLLRDGTILPGRYVYRVTVGNLYGSRAFWLADAERVLMFVHALLRERSRFTPSMIDALCRLHMAIPESDNAAKEKGEQE